MKNMFNVTTVLPHNLLQTNPCIRHNFSTQASESARHNFTMWALSCATFSGLLWRPENVAQLRAHSEVVPRVWRQVLEPFKSEAVHNISLRFFCLYFALLYFVYCLVFRQGGTVSDTFPSSGKRGGRGAHDIRSYSQ